MLLVIFLEIRKKLEFSYFRMADDQTVAILPAKRKRNSNLSSSQVVPCDECIRIQLKLIKTEGQIDILTAKCSKQAEKIDQLSNQIKQLQKNVKQLVSEKQQLENRINQNQNLVSVKYRVYLGNFQICLSRNLFLVSKNQNNESKHSGIYETYLNYVQS